MQVLGRQEGMGSKGQVVWKCHVSVLLGFLSVVQQSKGSRLHVVVWYGII